MTLWEKTLLGYIALTKGKYHVRTFIPVASSILDRDQHINWLSPCTEMEALSSHLIGPGYANKPGIDPSLQIGWGTSSWMDWIKAKLNIKQLISSQVE
ncbi:hypothetical protein CEXT_624841 [Caerostris extrusa]|uniref:Uncharacterized protein n=1 Tax=Caerostris extrusa TaxID=172846 RepID=A0AAV4XZ79_CAEEX|nr:hypothetical protein CEXT_624841 [Caerostris extrusa]